MSSYLQWLTTQTIQTGTSGDIKHLMENLQAELQRLQDAVEHLAAQHKPKSAVFDGAQ